MENRNFTEKIDKLLQGSMDAAERTDFEREVAQDAELKQEVKAHILEREAIKLMLQEDYKAKIQAWRSEAASTNTAAPVVEAKQRILQPRTRMRSLRPILSAAASLLLLLVAGSWFANNNYSDRAMISEAYLGASDPSDKSGETVLENNLQQGLQAFFVNEDYAQAASFFENIADPVAKNYYLGHAYLKLEDYAKSVAAFDAVLSNSTLPSYIDRTKLEYNRLLAKFGSGDDNAAFQQELDAYIQSARPPYKQKAEELKAKSGSFWRGLVF